METLKSIIDTCGFNGFSILLGLLLSLCLLGLVSWIGKSLLFVWRKNKSFRAATFFLALAVATLHAQKQGTNEMQNASIPVPMEESHERESRNAHFWDRRRMGNGAHEVTKPRRLRSVKPTANWERAFATRGQNGEGHTKSQNRETTFPTSLKKRGNDDVGNIVSQLNAPSQAAGALSTRNLRDFSTSCERISATAQIYAPWTLRGAADDWFILNFTNNWVFPHGSNYWTRCVVLTSGQVWDTTRGTNRLVAVGQQMSAVPDESSFTYERTEENSYLLTWNNFFLNRDTNQPITASLELKRNGDWIATSNEVSITHSRILPFAHDGYGQDDDWIRANFTNAEEILSVGYSQWVDEQVGYDLTNGFYKLTASFAETPLEAVNLTIGDYSVAVTNAGDYVFLLEKGINYELSAAPNIVDIDWWAADDLAESDPSPFALGPLANPPAEWTEDGGFNLTWNGCFGHVNWLPTLRGSPDVAGHLSPEDFPMTFTATLSDCNLNFDGVSFFWSGSPYLEINADGATAIVNANGMPSWGEFYLGVWADFGLYSLYSYLRTTCGTNNHPTVEISIDAPQVVFLNDDNRSTRYYQAQVFASCEVSTNVVVSFSQLGETKIATFTDSRGENAIDVTNVNVEVSIPAGERVKTHDFWFRCGNVGEGAFKVTTGCGVTNTATFRVIEPIQRLITNVSNWTDRRYYNPSRLVYGTNAWFCVDCHGPFPLSNITWQVVSGPAQIVITNNYSICVEPTADNGEVIIEARFGSVTNLQPRFVLPIVKPRSFPVRVYYVNTESDESDGGKPIRLTSFTNDLETANLIFAQIGVSFHQAGDPQEIGDPSYSVLPFRVSSGGLQNSTSLAAQTAALLRMPQETNCVRVFYVSSLTNTDAIAFSVPNWNSVVMSDMATNLSLAHELGHILGLEDIYTRRKNKYNREVSMPGYTNLVYAEIFEDKVHDWSGEDGRGFYETSDTHGVLVERLLMNGIDRSRYGIISIDIPSGSVFGYPSQPRHHYDRRFMKVGADSAIKKEWK